MRFEPAGEVGPGLEIEQSLAKGLDAREREPANVPLLPRQERSQAAGKLAHHQFNLSLMPAFLTTFFPAFLSTLGYSKPYEWIFAQNFLGDLHVPYATQFSLQFQTLLSCEFLVCKKETGNHIQFLRRPFCPHRIADEINGKRRSCGRIHTHASRKRHGSRIQLSRICPGVQAGKVYDGKMKTEDGIAVNGHPEGTQGI